MDAGLAGLAAHNQQSVTMFRSVLTFFSIQALGLLNEPDNSIYIHVTDNCPCLQYDNDSTTITGDNPPCCGNVNHFDLSYYGFEKLAHPNYGLMNLQFRSVPPW